MKFRKFHILPEFHEIFLFSVSRKTGFFIIDTQHAIVVIVVVVVIVVITIEEVVIRTVEVDRSTSTRRKSTIK